MPIQVNITTKVNSNKIRRERHNGREHIVLPSYTLPSNVIMNGGLYPSEEIDKHFPSLEGTLAPLGHPVLEGQYISAFSAEGINANHVGAWNRNVKKTGNRIYLEKWLDVEFAAKREDGQELLERISSIENGEDVPPIHTSVAAFLEQMEPSEEQKSQGAKWVARIESFDHDAILLNEVGAATPEQGVGMLVNADQATPLVGNDVLGGGSYRRREERIRQAANKKFDPQDIFCMVSDFTDDKVVLSFDGESRVYGYTSTEDGTVVLADIGEPVEHQESWVRIAANKIKQIFNPQARPAPNAKEEGDMPLTAEEKAELVKDIGESFSASMAEQIKPITEAIGELQANHKSLSEALTANQRAEEAEKRKAVSAKLGETVANALSGEALDEALAKLADDPKLAGNSASDDNETEKFDQVPE